MARLLTRAVHELRSRTWYNSVEVASGTLGTEEILQPEVWEIMSTE